MEGNQMKMRDALNDIVRLAKIALSVNSVGNSNDSELWDIIDKAKAAIYAPARNCDVMPLAMAKKVWFMKEIMPRLNGDLPLGKEISFEEWFVAPAAERKGECDDA